MLLNSGDLFTLNGRQLQIMNGVDLFVSLFDINGREIWSVQEAGFVKPIYDLSSLAVGSYVLKIQNGDRVQIQRIELW